MHAAGAAAAAAAWMRACVAACVIDTVYQLVFLPVGADPASGRIEFFVQKYRSVLWKSS
jgi:hypothetical protein